MEESSKAGWQPIETAPKDKIIDLYYKGWRRFTDCFWCKFTESWQTKIWDGTSRCISASEDPTHWMPTPAPPSHRGNKMEQSSKTEWRSIETAPKDGRIFATTNETGYCCSMFYHDGYMVAWQQRPSFPFFPVLWMELPPEIAALSLQCGYGTVDTLAVML